VHFATTRTPITDAKVIRQNEDDVGLGSFTTRRRRSGWAVRAGGKGGDEGGE
jgi:hypothetical protein